jgi:hypothetical protein
MATRWYGMPNSSEPRYGLLASVSYACLICRDLSSQLKGVDFWTRFHKSIYDAGIRSGSIADFPAILAQSISAELSRVIVKGLAIPLEDDPNLPKIGIFNLEGEIVELDASRALAPAYWMRLVEDCCRVYHYTDEDVLEIARDITKSQWLVVSCRLRKLEDDMVKADKLKELEKEIIEVEAIA